MRDRDTGHSRGAIVLGLDYHLHKNWALRMRVITRTFPPNSNPNYGGILQAWALQRALMDLGHTPYVDSTRSSQASPPRAFLRTARRAIIDKFVPASFIPPRFMEGVVTRTANRDLLKFPREEVRSVALYRGRRRVHQDVLGTAEAFIVGSDQVWRAAYVDVPSFLLDFLPVDHRAIRVAYAASFGVSSASEFTEEVIEETRILAHRFDALSVREESGVKLAEELWGVKARRVIDPTMLLTRDRYESLLPQSGRLGGVASYVLDASDVTNRLAEEAARSLKTDIRQLFPPTARSISELRRSPNRYRRPTVNEWLQHLSSADAVITDSYHGTLFSILFNRPFLVAPNRSRGLTRFETALNIADLTDRVVRNDGNDLLRLHAPIDWNAVNSRITAERESGLAFLADALTRSS